MLADLRYRYGVDWHALDMHERAEVAAWWSVMGRPDASR